MIHRELVLLLGGALTVGRGLRTAKGDAGGRLPPLCVARPVCAIYRPFLRTAAQVGRSFAMAQPQAVVMAPHNYTSTLAGLAPTVHVSTVIPNFCIAEYFGQFPGSVPRHCLDRHPLLPKRTH